MIWTGERVVPIQMSADVRTYQEHLARYTWALSYVARKGHVLDAACGCGYGTEMLRHVILGTAYGADLDDDALAYGRGYYPYCQFLRADLSAGEPYLAAGSLDAILSFETVEHLERPAVWLATAARLLRPGGVFLSSVPLNAPSPYHRQVYEDVHAVEQLLKPTFPRYSLYTQTGINIAPLTGAAGQFVLAVATTP